MKSVFIIAEAGVNHNGRKELAFQMVDAAAQAGADAVKFQTFKTENLVTTYAPKADYQKKTFHDRDNGQFQMLKKLELNEEAFREIKDYCESKKILFLSSAFDLESINWLIQLGLQIFKIPSGEITNLPYLRKIGQQNGKVILSTGMATMDEIRDALKILTSAGTDKENITVLHCHTEYPTPMDDVNLRAMLHIRDEFDVKVGYSDHTTGIEVPIAAVALGAEVIEKHFTLDRNLPGPDHAASLEPDELSAMVKAIRNIEKALGDGLKKPSPREIKNRIAARKSIVAARDIKKGEPFTEENLTVKRPGTGINPMEWDRVVNSIAPRDFKKDELIEL